MEERENLATNEDVLLNKSISLSDGQNTEGDKRASEVIVEGLYCLLLSMPHGLR
jgi:hypothetical protein